MRCLFVIVTHSIRYNASSVFEQLAGASICEANERFVVCKGPLLTERCDLSLENRGDEPLAILDAIVRFYARLGDIDRLQFVPITAFYRAKHRRTRALWIARKLAVFDSFYDACGVRGRVNPKFQIRRWKDQALTAAAPRPIGAWASRWVNTSVCAHNPNQCSFSVSTRDVLRRPLPFYVAMRSQFEHCAHCEAVHYVERLWPYVFLSTHNGVNLLRC